MSRDIHFPFNPFPFYPMLFPGPGEAGGGLLNARLRDAKGQAEMARPPETPARHRQDVLLLEPGHAGQVVAPRRLGEEIKGPSGLDKIVAGPFQDLAEQLPPPDIGGDIDADFRQAGHHPLHQGRGVDKAQDAVGQHHTGKQLSPSRRPGAHRGVTQALSGDGEVLGKGSGQQGVRVGREDAGEFKAVVDDAAVRLIGHQVNRAAVAAGVVGEQAPQLF